MRLFTLITFFAFSALFSLGLNAFEIKDSFSEKLRPSMSIERDDSGITVEISIKGAIQEEDDLFPGSFSLNIPGFGLNMTSGEPALPLRVDRYEIPFGMTAEVQVLESHYSVIAKKISPARPDLINSSGDSYSLSNIAKIKPYDNWFPEHPISEGGIKIYRDRQLLSICFYPIAYNWESEEIKVFDTIKYKIKFIENTACYAQRNQNYVIHEVDSVYMRNVFTSYDQDSSNNQCDNISNYKLGGTLLEPVFPPDVAFNWKKGEGYLILSRSCYESAVNKFSKWKRSLGYDTHMVMNGTWTPNSIRNAIKNQYDSDPNLKYVLFVGDELDIPGELKTSIYYSDGNPTVVPYYTDYFYCCMDGSQDDTPDLISGRLSVTTLNEANIVVDKIINYEKYYNSESRNRVAHCSEFSDLYREVNNLVGSDGIEDRNFTRTSEYISVGAESLGKSVKRIYNYNGAQNITPQKWSKYAGGEGRCLII